MPSVARMSRLHLLLIPALFAVAGCASAGAPSANVGSGSIGGGPPASAPTASSVTDPGSGGGSSGNAGSGVGSSLPPGSTPGDPVIGKPTLVRPEPGRLNPRPVAPIGLKASVDGRHVQVTVSWYGGVAPCSVLDSVTVERTGRTIALTVIEGSSDLMVACPDLAMLKATIVDLGELDPGTWTITAPNSDAPPIQVTIG